MTFMAFNWVEANGSGLTIEGVWVSIALFMLVAVALAFYEYWFENH